MEVPGEGSTDGNWLKTPLGRGLPIYGGGKGVTGGNIVCCWRGDIAGGE